MLICTGNVVMYIYMIFTSNTVVKKTILTKNTRAYQTIYIIFTRQEIDMHTYIYTHTHTHTHTPNKKYMIICMYITVYVNAVVTYIREVDCKKAIIAPCIKLFYHLLNDLN